MMPKDFERILREVGFEILPMVNNYPPASPGAGFVRRKLINSAKNGTRWPQNALGLPYKRFVYIVQKP